MVYIENLALRMILQKNVQPTVFSVISDIWWWKYGSNKNVPASCKTVKITLMKRYSLLSPISLKYWMMIEPSEKPPEQLTRGHFSSWIEAASELEVILKLMPVHVTSPWLKKKISTMRKNLLNWCNLVSIYASLSIFSLCWNTL